MGATSFGVLASGDFVGWDDRARMDTRAQPFAHPLARDRGGGRRLSSAFDLACFVTAEYLASLLVAIADQTPHSMLSIEQGSAKPLNPLTVRLRPDTEMPPSRGVKNIKYLQISEMLIVCIQSIIQWLKSRPRNLWRVDLPECFCVSMSQAVSQSSKRR